MRRRYLVGKVDTPVMYRSWWRVKGIRSRRHDKRMCQQMEGVVRCAANQAPHTSISILDCSALVYPVCPAFAGRGGIPERPPHRRADLDVQCHHVVRSRGCKYAALLSRGGSPEFAIRWPAGENKPITLNYTVKDDVAAKGCGLQPPRSQGGACTEASEITFGGGFFEIQGSLDRICFYEYVYAFDKMPRCTSIVLIKYVYGFYKIPTFTSIVFLALTFSTVG